jgi:alpha-N-arabinofuranosidase
MLPGTNLNTLDGASLPVAAAGNVFVKGAPVSKHEQAPLVNIDFDPKLKLTQKADGWYLTLAQEKAWKGAPKRLLVTTALLGKATVPDEAFENSDGSPLKVDADYFRTKRDAGNPFPGPFETPVDGEIKVWPKKS